MKKAVFPANAGAVLEANVPSSGPVVASSIWFP
jgi:hypothetical protein